MEMKIKKRGVSPVVASVLLIAIVVILALIVFFWLRGMSNEAITKFGGQNVKVLCPQVDFQASYSGGYVYISNGENIPIYRMKAEIYNGGSHQTITIGNNTGTPWPAVGLLQGGTYSGQIPSGSKIILIPVLLGSTQKHGNQEYTCDPKYGKDVGAN